MKIQDLPVDRLQPAPWNPNEADEATLRRLSASLGRFGTVLPLVVRPLGEGYEVVAGNQRLKIYRQDGVRRVPCVVLELDDVQARLLAQVLNRVHGEDDLNRKAALVRELLDALPAEDVAALLPDSLEALRGLASLTRTDGATLGEALAAWERARAVRLERISFPFTPAQREIVEEAIALALPRVREADEPNRRALALVTICEDWLASQSERVVSAPTQPRQEGSA